MNLKVSEQDLSRVSHILEIYSRIIMCKNLGIQISAAEIDVTTLKLVHYFFTVYEDSRTKSNGK